MNKEEVAIATAIGHKNARIKQRDEFAGKALQGWLSSYSDGANFPDDLKTVLAQNCYKMADAMMEARDK